MQTSRQTIPRCARSGSLALWTPSTAPYSPTKLALGRAPAGRLPASPQSATRRSTSSHERKLPMELAHGRLSRRPAAADYRMERLTAPSFARPRTTYGGHAADPMAYACAPRAPLLAPSPMASVLYMEASLTTRQRQKLGFHGRAFPTAALPSRCTRSLFRHRSLRRHGPSGIGDGRGRMRMRIAVGTMVGSIRARVSHPRARRCLSAPILTAGLLWGAKSC